MDLEAHLAALADVVDAGHAYVDEGADPHRFLALWDHYVNLDSLTVLLADLRATRNALGWIAYGGEQECIGRHISVDSDCLTDRPDEPDTWCDVCIALAALHREEN